MKSLTLSLMLILGVLSPVTAQDSSITDQARQRAAEAAEAAKQRAAELAAAAKERGSQLADATREKVGDLSQDLQQRAADFEDSEDAQRASSTVLEWIQSAEKLYAPWINWVLVAVGIGVFISHAGQLILGKLWTIGKGKGLDFGEALNDFLVMVFTGLALPAVLLIPVGHGAFISSPLKVLSAAGVGMILGVILYSHGMKQEMLAAQEKQDREAAGDDA